MTTDEIVGYVIDTFEGKLYTDDPVDTGGATKFGITRRTLEYYRRKITGDPTLQVTKQDVKNLTRTEAVDCATFVFAHEPGIDQIPDWRVRLVVFDYGFHSGSRRAIKALQKAVSATEDGLLGPLTLAALEVSPDLPITFQILTAREEFMQRIMEANHTQRRFMLGWWKRTTQLQKVVLA